MNVASVQFLLLSMVTVIVCALPGACRWRQPALLAANLYFLSTFTHQLTSFVPLCAFVLVGYAGAVAVARGQRRLFWPALLLDVAMLIWLKRYAFIPSGLLLNGVYLTVGLSYLCFRMIYVLIEARDGELRSIAPLSYLNYTINFLTLVSGPIQAYRDFNDAQQSAVSEPLTIIDIGRGVERIALGFFKVILLSAAFQGVQTHGLSLAASTVDAQQRLLAGCLIIGSYPLYLYANFSGYTDIVIGVGRLLRMPLPENFDRPFLAPNFMLFWGRWHMTLSSFFRTYFFNPLVMLLMRRFPGSAAAPFLAVFAFFVTFFVLGVWHGQTSEFIAYGLVLGAGVSVNKLYQVLMARALGQKGYLALTRGPLYTAVCRGMTFTYFALSLLLFWSTWPQLAGFWNQLGAVAWCESIVGLFAVATIALAMADGLRTQAAGWSLGDARLFESRYVRTVMTTLLACVTWFAITIVSAPAPANVYQAF